MESHKNGSILYTRFLVSHSQIRLKILLQGEEENLFQRSRLFSSVIQSFPCYFRKGLCEFPLPRSRNSQTREGSTLAILRTTPSPVDSLEVRRLSRPSFLFLSTLCPYLFSVLPFETSRRTLEISGVSRTGKSRFRTPNSAELNSSFDAEFVLIATAVSLRITRKSTLTYAVFF